MHKSMALDLLEKNNISTTDRMLINKNDRNIIEEMNFIKFLFIHYKKIIIKPNDDGCSAFVCTANTLEQVTSAINTIFENNKNHCLIEGCIEGIELTIGIIGNQKHYLVLPITQTIKSENILSIEEKFLPGAGENITPALFDNQTTEKIKYEIRKTYRILECDGYARIDCFWDHHKEQLIVLECNTLPALTPATCLFHQAAELDINPSEFINYIIYLGYKNKNKENFLNTDFITNIKKTEHIINENINKQLIFQNT